MTPAADHPITPSGDTTGMRHAVTAGAIDVSHGPILYVENVSVSFDGFKALNDLSFALDAGELRCVIGPNGAGKTTMMDVITGKTQPDAGTVFFGQTIDLTKMSEPEIADIGIGRKFQKPTVFESHTVFENLELAMKMDKGVWSSLFYRISAEQHDRIHETLKHIQLESRANTAAGLLSHGQKQWLEIGRLLMQGRRYLRHGTPKIGHEIRTPSTPLLCRYLGDWLSVRRLPPGITEPGSPGKPGPGVLYHGGPG